MEKRIKQLRAVLKQKDLAAAVLRLPENIILCSHYFPRNSFSFVFIPQEGEAVLIAPQGDQNDPERGTLSQVRRFGWVRLVDGNPLSNVADILKELKEKSSISDNMRIGVDYNADLISPALCFGEALPPGRATLNMISSVFAAKDLVEFMPEISAIREVKLPEEIEKIELCNEIGYLGIDRFTQLASDPGLREIDIAAEVESCIAKATPGYKGAARFGRAIAQVTSGKEHTSKAWFAGMVSTDRKVESGDFVMLEMGVTVDGFWCDLTRTVVAGEPDAEQSKMMQAVKASQQAAIAAMRPGVTAGEIDATARSEIAKFGYNDGSVEPMGRGAGFSQHNGFVHPLGHGVGFAYHDGQPIFFPGAEVVLKEGMVFSCEPGVYLPEKGGVRQESNVLLTANGARELAVK